MSKSYCILFLILIGCKIEEPQLPPSVKTIDASEVTTISATLNGSVIEEGFSATNERGFVYSEKNTNPSVSDLKIISGYGKGEYFSKLDRLSVNTKYFFKAFATNSKGTSYGSVLSFTTADYSLPSLNTDEPKNIGYTTVDLGGIILTSGGANVTSRGICYSINPNPTINDGKVIIGSGLGSFTLNLTNLKDNTKYYIRAFATNAKGTAYGNEISFTTTEFKVPSLNTKEVNSVGSTSIIAGSEILDNGGTEIIERGFCINTSGTPTIMDTKILSGNGSGSFFSEINNLKESTVYYLRPYALNVKGIGYGKELSFKTLSSLSIGQNLKNNLQAYYALNGSSVDLGPNKIDLISKGEVVSKTAGLDPWGNSNSCFGFNGFGGIVSSNSKLNDDGKGFTINFWAKTTLSNIAGGTYNSKWIGINLSNDNGNEFNFYISGNYYFFNNEFNTNSLILQSDKYFDNIWHNFTLSIDYINNYARFYMDGKMISSKISNFKNLNLFNLGIGGAYERLLSNLAFADTKFSRREWSGYIDNVGFWNRTLSKEEIDYLYKNNYTP